MPRWAKWTDAERFAAKYEVAASGCWLWTASVSHRGYGQFALGKKMLRAHRAAWLMHCGPIPDGLHVLHKCDTPACVNPDHLFLGTNADNQADMDHKGRRCDPPVLVGESNNFAKLTEDDVRAIRAATGTLESIGAMFGVNKSNVCQIKRRLTWKHVA